MPGESPIPPRRRNPNGRGWRPSARGASGFLGAVARFLRACGGNIAVVSGLAVVPLVLASGVGIDLARAMVVKARLTEALDAAGLAVGGTPGLSADQLQELAQAYFDANYPAGSLGTPGALSLSQSGSTLTVSAEATLPTTLMHLAGYEVIDVAVEVEVTRESKGLEVALVLDNTGSMWGSKLSALKKAANALIDILAGSESYPEKLKIGLVPFTQTVRLDPGVALANGWMDANGQSSVARLNFDGGMYAFSVLETMRDTDWRGCVEARPDGLDELDTPPGAGDPDTLWVPYFQPDEPDTSSRFTNDYLDDRTKGSDLKRQNNSDKYDRKRAESDVNGDCVLPPILQLTNDMNLVRDRIGDMIAAGYTHIPLGAVWGWRVLSPAEPFSEGTPYGDPDFQKAMILMTDGENTIPPQSTFNDSRYSAYGYVRQGRLGTSSPGQARRELDYKLERVCANVRNEKIRLYTIGFMISDQDTLDLLRDCATEPSMFFNSPSNSELEAAFQAIATDLSNLRLSR